MAKAYLGKISALVTANTSDFNSKLNASAKEVRSFASSMQSVLSRAETSSTSSLRGIYTEAQKLERALKAAGSVRLSFKGVETGSLDDASRRLQQLFSVTQSITKPLEASSKAFSGLSAEVQAGFLPALISAQKATESITATINRVGSVGEAQFAAVERKVIETTAAIARLREASSAVGSLATGQELRFQRPDFVAETQRSAALQSQISQLSPQQISGGGFSDLVSQQRAAAVEAERLAAALERARLARGGDVAEATSAYDAQIARQRQLNDQIEREINLAGEATAASRRRAEAASRLLRVNQSESTLLSNQGAASTTDATGRSLQQRLQDIARLRELEQQAAQATLAAAEAQEEAAAATRRRVDAASRLLQINQSESTLLSNQGAASTTDATGRSLQQRLQDIARLREAEASLAREREVAANVGASSQLASTVDPTGRSIQQRLRDIAALREAEASLNREREIAANVGARSQRATILPNDYFSGSLARDARESLSAPLDAGTRQLELFRAGIVSAKSQLDAMPAAIRLHFIPAIQGAEQEFVRLSALGPRATAEEIENAARNMDTLAAAVRRTTQASQLQGFGDFISDANVRQAVGELQGLQRVLIQVGAVAGGPAARAYEIYRARLQEAVRAGTTGLPTVRRELELLQRAAAEAAASTGRISVGNAFRQIQRSGDVARGGVDRFSLALNQAAFAIDDFFSSTGGIEFKLRAVSNNITQLAFILGGTTGLFIGLGAVIGGQLAVAIAKYAFGLEDAKKRQEALKAQADALNATLDRQKSLVEELASAYRDLGRDIKQATLSPQGARFEQRQERAQEVRQQQADRRREQVAGIVPAVAANRGRRQQLEAQINELPLGAERAAAQRRADRLRAQEDQVVARVERAAAARVGQNQEGLRDRRDFFQNRLESLQRDRARVARDSGERDPRIAVFDRQINEAGEQLAEFTLALQRINDEAISTAFQFSGPLQDAIQRAQERLSSAFGDQRAPQQDTLDRAGRALGDLPGRITNENLSPAGTRRAIADVEALARPAIEAANRLADFATALTDARESARRADEEARQRVQDLQSEVSRNPNDRTLQAQLRAAQAGAAELGQRRQAVERDVQRGFGEAGLGPQANQTRQQQVRTDSDATSRFAEDLKRQGDLIARGFDIARPALEEFGRQLEQDLTALGEAAKADRQNAAQIIEDGRRNLAEQAAPMLVEMAKSVQNAVIAGPSRAALNASDVTTSQGQQELNRLLRGDDAAREADVVEMKNQTQKLTSIDTGIQELVKKIGVAQ